MQNNWQTSRNIFFYILRKLFFNNQMKAQKVLPATQKVPLLAWKNCASLIGYFFNILG